ncbi:hypothetical protein [Fulvimonas soli]|jgi:hypothetical protein|uniref:Uncharacterized protein n=1 Tax=Fulvimonas soli TaxID=155197 RepID=A0A316HRG0_9GAMM|nr:hypothetical protein [Fulvimonas soli]PWK82708.1 hypothetical protein C7456_1155 [Fulvimonas soli]TNY25320.1 hypothetical protein BV497_14520 [Fulvimonas soli]
MASLGVLAGMGMLGLLGMVVVSLLVGALLLSLAYRIVVGTLPSYLTALGTVLVGGIAGWVAALVLRVLLHTGGGLLAVPVHFLAGAAAVHFMLPAPTGTRLDFGKACLVQLLYLVMFIALGIVAGLVLSVLFGGALLAGMHHG